jgi:hypothetical protein
MAITNYDPPQLNVKQVLDVDPNINIAPMRALVAGPRYVIVDADDAATVDFTAGEQTLPWVNQENSLPSGLVADTESVTVHGTALEAVLAEYTPSTTGKFYLNSALSPFVLKLSGGSGGVSGASLDSLLHGRAVQVGDVAYVNDGVSGLRRRVVTGVIGADVPSSYGSNVAADDQDFANAPGNPVTTNPVVGDNPEIVSSPDDLTLSVDDVSAFSGLVKGAKYGTKYGEQFIITVHTPGDPGVAKVNVSSASGLFSATAVETSDDSGDYLITDEDADGNLAGLTLRISPSLSEELTVGQSFVFNVYGVYDQLSVSQVVGSDTGNGYTGPVDTIYSLEVIEGTAAGISGAVVRISSSSGLEASSTVAISDSTPFLVGGFGLRAAFDFSSPPDQLGLRTGDVYYIRAKAATQSATVFDKVILSGPASNLSLFNNTETPISVEFRLPFSGEIESSDAPVGLVAWSVSTAGGVTVEPQLSLNVPDRSAGYTWVPFKTGVGTLKALFRAVYPPESDDRLFLVEDQSDIVSVAGVIDPRNPVAFGAQKALIAAEDSPVWILLTDGESAEDFSAALETIENRDDTYSIALMTDDVLVMGVGVAHVNGSSSQSKMHWRRLYVGSDSPGEYTLLGLKSNQSNYSATISASEGGNVYVVAEEGTNFTASNVESGSIFRLNTGERYIVGEVVSDNELLLETGPESPISSPVAFTVLSPNTPRSQADYIISRSRALGNRRCMHVWCEGATTEGSSGTSTVSSKFFAAEIAGLRSKLLPHQGLSRRGLYAASSATPMFARYSQSLLNEIAANGTAIVMQDSESSGLYLRHQLTTNPNDGLLYYEDSVGVNIDSVSFHIKSVLDGYVGKYNVNSKTVNAIQSILESVLSELTTVDEGDQFGPQIIDIARLQISIPAGQADTLAILVQVYVPVPLNKILVTLQASVDPTTGVVSTQIIT